jgi:hypothetical protein
MSGHDPAEWDRHKGQKPRARSQLFSAYPMTRSPCKVEDNHRPRIENNLYAYWRQTMAKDMLTMNWGEPRASEAFSERQSNNA